MVISFAHMVNCCVGVLRTSSWFNYCRKICLLFLFHPLPLFPPLLSSNGIDNWAPSFRYGITAPPTVEFFIFNEPEKSSIMRVCWWERELLGGGELNFPISRIVWEPLSARRVNTISWREKFSEKFIAFSLFLVYTGTSEEVTRRYKFEEEEERDFSFPFGRLCGFCARSGVYPNLEA